MRLLSMFAIISLFGMMFSCEKPDDPDPTPPTVPVTPTGPTAADSTYILGSIEGNFFEGGTTLYFEYDTSNNRLIRFKTKPGETKPTTYHLMYKNNRLNHIVVEAKEFDQVIKSSMVFVYDANGRCKNVFYKDRFAGYSPSNDHPYFTDLGDGNLDYQYDSLIYSPTGRIEEIRTWNRLSTTPFKPFENKKFFYADASDSTMNKILIDRYKPDGTPYAYDALTFTPSYQNNPSAPFLWYLPFTLVPSFALSATSARVPIFMDGPSSYAASYISYATKFVDTYAVYNTWGSHNYTKTVFNYSKTNEKVAAYIRGNPFTYVEYKFTRVKKK